jgi:hypothetical protein
MILDREFKVSRVNAAYAYFFNLPPEKVVKERDEARAEVERLSKRCREARVVIEDRWWQGHGWERRRSEWLGGKP